MEGLPTPPNEDHLKSHASKKQHSNSKPVKAVHRGSKRATTHAHHPPSPSHESSHTHSSSDGRHKRVWKACERCRMKKTKVFLSLPRLSRCLSVNPLLTRATSVMESSLAKGVRMMDWFAPLVLERRRNTSNYLEGK